MIEFRVGTAAPKILLGTCFVRLSRAHERGFLEVKNLTGFTVMKTGQIFVLLCPKRGYHFYSKVDESRPLRELGFRKLEKGDRIFFEQEECL